MGINISEARTVFQNELDKQMTESLTSAWMDANAGQVIYNGGKEIKIPRIEMDGMKDYDRAAGYPVGGVSLDYQTMTMEMDRGESFMLDAMDVNETNFMAAAGNVLGEFQRTKVVPEVDAYRYSKIHKIVSAEKAAHVVGKALTEANIYKTITDDIAAVQDICGESTQLIIVMNGLVRNVLNNNTTFQKNLAQSDFTVGAVTTKVRTVMECPIIQVPSARMYSAYTFWKGSEEGGAKGGFEKVAGAKLMNYIIMPRAAAIAVCKQDKSKIIDPDTNQKADAWFIGYRKYHDLWIKDSQLDAIRISTEA